VALGRYQRRHGAIDPRAHFGDALITSCAAQRGATIATEIRCADLDAVARTVFVQR